LKILQNTDATDMETSAMSKYEPLWKHLEKDRRENFRMSFDDIAVVLGFPIDHSFLNAKKEAKAFGYTVGKISLKEQFVTFEKLEEAQP